MTQRDVAGIYIDGLPWKLSFDINSLYSLQFICFIHCGICPWVHIFIHI